MHSLINVKSTVALLAIALTVVPGLQTIAKAQGLDQLPPCAMPALMESVQTAGCAITDVKCICSRKDDIFPAVRKAVKDACSEAEQDAVKAMAKQYCGKDAVPGASPPTATMSMTGTMTMTSGMTPTTMATMETMETTETKGMGRKTTYQRTMTYSTTSTGSAGTVQTGAAVRGVREGMSAVGVVMAVCGLSWIFAEL